MSTSTASMGGGPNTLDNRPTPMGGGHGMHGSTVNPAVSQGHSVGHPATRGGGYNTGPVATSSSTGYGPMGNTEQVRCQIQAYSKVNFKQLLTYNIQVRYSVI